MKIMMDYVLPIFLQITILITTHISGCLSQYSDKNALINEYITKAEFRVLPSQPNDTFAFKFNTKERYGDVGFQVHNYRHNPEGLFEIQQVILSLE